MKKSDRERRTDASTCKMMPVDFEPGPYEVLIGRGRRCTMHWGNQRFRGMIRDELEGYAAADCKRHKSSIIGRVLGDIKKYSPHAGFVKKDVATGRWLSLTDAASRVSIAQAFRDALEDNYRSSKHSKQVKRRVEKKVEPGEDGLEAPQEFAPQELSSLPPLSATYPGDEVQQQVPEEDPFNVRLGDLEFEGFDDFDLDPLPLEPMTVPLPAAALVAPSPPMVEEEGISRGEFDLLFEAFAGSQTMEFNMMENPFEPLPIAAAQQEPRMSRKRQRSRSRDHKPVVKDRSMAATGTAFGSKMPFRSCAVARGA